MSARWYVVHTQPNAELRADKHLRGQGFVTFLPKLLKRRRHARKTETVSRPLFPRYVFVQLDTVHQGWYAIRSTLGVSNLVGGGQGPTPVRDDVVEALRARQRADGFFCGQAHKFASGDTIRVVDGIFASAVGFFECMSDKDRVSVLLEILGRRVRVALDQESLTAA